MKRSGRSHALLASALSAFAFWSLPAQATSWSEAFLATGTLSTFPYADKNKALQCSAVHLGNRHVLTAGHCFLGANTCLGATVVFNGEARKPFPQKARCLRMISIHAAAFRDGTPNETYALFEVDRAPAFSASLSTEPLPSEGNVRLFSPEGVVGSKNDSLGRTPLYCDSLLPAPSDPFGRPRRGNVFETRCPHSGFAHGAPLFALFPNSKETTNQKNLQARLVGIAQGAYLPATGGGPRTVFQDVRDAIPRALIRQESPHRITAGHFSSDAFPFGLDGNLDFELASFPHPGPHTLAISQAALTEVEVIDGRGQATLYKGTPSLASTSPQIYEGPVRVRVRTPKNARSVHAEILLTAPSQRSVNAP